MLLGVPPVKNQCIQDGTLHEAKIFKLNCEYRVTNGTYIQLQRMRILVVCRERRVQMSWLDVLCSMAVMP